MNQQLFHCAWLAASFLLLFTIAELLYHKAKVQVEYTRKLVHVGTGILTLLFPVFLEIHWYVLLLCGSFALILLTSQRFGFLKSINAIDRKSYGSLSYPVAVYSCFLFSMYAFSNPQTGLTEPRLTFFYIPVLTLAICDPIAALIGKRYPWKPYKVGDGKKTASGTLAFLISAVVLCFIILYYFGGHPSAISALIVGVLIAIATSLAEAFSRNGFDNLTIPGAAVLVLYAISQTPLMF